MGGPNICVVGGGVVGLTTAVMLQEQAPKAQVRIVSDKWSPDTTSNVAAGIFLWGPHVLDPDTDRVWADDSWRWFSALQAAHLPLVTGVTELPCLLLSRHHADTVTRRHMARLAPVCRDATPRELNLALPEGEFKHGKFLQTLQIDMDIYLGYLTDKFRSRGGVLQQAKVDSLASLADQCDIAVNCAGLGARWLANDPATLPLRGQVLRVAAPWVKTALYADDVYAIPGQRWVTVGGTRQYGDWMAEVSPHDSARIWSRATATFPTLAGAKLLEEVVGLRPHRYTPRVEAEAVSSKLTVVHNYGHCGYGVLSSPGTSSAAAALVKQILEK